MKHILVALLVVGFSQAIFGADTGNLDPYDRQLDLVDKHVRIQGIGWGLGAKGLGIRVVTPSGTTIYLKPDTIGADKGFVVWQGRLIEVTGILRKRIMTGAPPGAQGYTHEFEYLAIEGFKIRGIDRVTSEIAATTEQQGADQPAAKPAERNPTKVRPQRQPPENAPR